MECFDVGNVYSDNILLLIATLLLVLPTIFFASSHLQIANANATSYSPVKFLHVLMVKYTTASSICL